MFCCYFPLFFFLPRMNFNIVGSVMWLVGCIKNFISHCKFFSFAPSSCSANKLAPNLSFSRFCSACSFNTCVFLSVYESMVSATLAMDGALYFFLPLLSRGGVWSSFISGKMLSLLPDSYPTFVSVNFLFYPSPFPTHGCSNHLSWTLTISHVPTWPNVFLVFVW